MAHGAGGQNGGKQYTRIYKSDIWSFIIDSDFYFDEIELGYTNEFVFENRYEGEYSPIDDPIAIRWFTSVDKQTEVSRPKGEDAMRVMLVHLPTGKPIFQAERTHRIPTWKKNLTKKIERLKNKMYDLPMCPKCDSVLVVVKSNQGRLFRGCSNYFDNKKCTFTKPLED